MQMNWSMLEAHMNWIVLLWAVIVLALIVLSAFAWRDTLKTEEPVRPHIDDIPFRPNHHRHSDDDLRH
jgi:hypothetical protein